MARNRVFSLAASYALASGAAFTFLVAATAVDSGQKPVPRADVIHPRSLDAERERVPRSVHEPQAERKRQIAPGLRGSLVVVRGRSAAMGHASGVEMRFVVEVEGGLRVDRYAFARAVVRTLLDPRSWAGGGAIALQRVDSGQVDFRVALASPGLTDRLCLPLQTNGIYSCASGNRAVVNAMRWRLGAATYDGRLRAYRRYVVNHEVGHLLGHGHDSCPGAEELAPVMLQQTKGVAPCRANPWPLPSERGG